MKRPLHLTQKTLLRFALQGTVLGVLAGSLVILFTVDANTLEHFQQFRWSVNLLLFPLIFLAWLCNGCRILVLSRSLGYPLRYTQTLAVSLSSEFGIAATPAGMGGAIIRLSLLRRAGVSLAHGTTMLATDIALDTLFFTLLFPFALLSLLRNRKLIALFHTNRAEAWIPVGLWLVLGILLLLFLIRTKAARRRIKFFFHASLFKRYRVPARIRYTRRRLMAGLRQMREGFHILFRLRPESILANFGLAAIQWTCRYSILPIVLYAFSIPNDPILFFLLQGILFTFSLFFVLPGGGGGVEVMTALILPLIIPHSLVGIVILIWRFFTYHLYLLGGGITFFTTCARLNTLFPQPVSPEEEEEMLFGNTR